MESERIALLPMTPVIFESVTLQLCGDFEALIEAQSFFQAQGHDLDLASAIFNARDADSALRGLRQLLPCALHTFHPELTYEAVQSMINRALACDNPVFIKAVGRMWPAHEASSQAIMARFFERLSDEWKQQFYVRVIAESWPGAAQA